MFKNLKKSLDFIKSNLPEEMKGNKTEIQYCDNLENDETYVLFKITVGKSEILSFANNMTMEVAQ